MSITAAAVSGGVDSGGVDNAGVNNGEVNSGGVDNGGVNNGGVDSGGVDNGDARVAASPPEAGAVMVDMRQPNTRPPTFLRRTPETHDAN